MIAADMSKTKCPEDYQQALECDIGIAELFDLQAARNPDKIAIIHGSTSTTYREVQAAAQSLALRIRQSFHITHEQLVGILIARGCQHVIAQLAILYLGATCVPLDPDMPDSTIADRITDFDISLVLANSTTLPRLSVSHAINIEEVSCSTTSYDGSDSEDDSISQESYFQPEGTSMDHRTHLLFTSGTTGRPKAVEILARSVVHVSFNVHDTPLPSEAVVGHPSQITFDISLFDIWATLTRGASLVVIDKEVLLDESALVQLIEREGISVLLVTAAAVNLVAAINPSAFAKLDSLLFGGEVYNREIVTSILQANPPKKLITVYGPTECCIFSLTHQLTLDDLSKPTVSLGRPIGRTVTYILDDDCKPVATGEIGEMCIAGDGVSRGYYGAYKRTKESFIDLDSPSGATNIHGKTIRTYKTGDFVRGHQDGSVEFMGRRDHQVKIRGHRIELNAVEEGILKTGYVAATAALKLDSENDGSAAVLVAFVELKTGISMSAAALTEVLQQVLPHYMVPQINIINKMPLNNHLKIDRSALKREAVSLRRSRVESGSHDYCDSGNGDAVMETVKSLWVRTLAIASQNIEPDSDFFKLGGTSIQAALLLHRLRKNFTDNISMRDVYEHSQLLTMTTLVIERQKGMTFSTNESLTWVADSEMADQILIPADTTTPNWLAPEEGRVFITGATGFVGLHLVADLLAMSEVKAVACLVRAETEVQGLSRLKGLMERYQLWHENVSFKIRIFCGDIQDNYLGLGEQEFMQLGSWSSTIFHLAARVNYIQPYSTHRPANTIGTYNIIRLAVSGRLKSIHYTSSIAAFGPSGFVNGCTIIREDDDLDKHLPALPFDQGYAQSQWVVDRMMTRCMTRGLPVAIYRPGFVVGSTKTGISNRDDFLNRLVDGCFAIGAYPSLPRQGKEFVTVDYVCRMMLTIAQKRENLRQAYHLTPPDRSLSLDLKDFFLLLQVSRPDLPALKELPYQHWLQETIDQKSERLAPLLPMLQERVSGERTRWEMYENMPLYDTTNTKRAVAAAGAELEYPVVNRELVKFYLDRSYPPN